MLSQEIIGNLIKSFHLAVTYLKIYPPTSQMVVATFDTFHKTALNALEAGESVTFSELSGKLLVEGTEPDNREIQLIGGNLLKFFNQRKIQSVTLRRGLTREELADFMAAVLRKKREELPEFPHIALDQTVYVAMVKGEEAVVKITEMVQNAGSDMVGMIKTLRESYDLIDRLPDQNARLAAHERLAQELARQDTAILRDIFERELPPKIEESGLKKRLLSALSQEKIQEIFGEISGWYEEIRKKEASDFEAVEQLEKLKKFMQVVLQAPAAKDIPRQFFEELLRKGLLEQLPEWLSMMPSKPTTVFEVERLLEKPAAELLEKETLDNLPQLAEKLCRMENNELLAKLVEKLLENLQNAAAKIRLPAAQSIVTIHDVLKAQARENLLRYMEFPLLEAARKETSFEVHRLLLDLLRQRARQDLLHGEYDLAIRIIDLMRQHDSEGTADEKIRSSAQAALGRLFPEIVDVLITDMRSAHEAKRLGALQILAKMGDLATEPLVRVIKESEDVRSRRLAALALKNLGEPAIRRFNEELNFGLIADEIKRVIEALGELGTEETTEHLEGLLRYPDASVKKEIMKFLARSRGARACLLLIGMLKDNDTVAVSEAARLLGDLKCTEAVPALVALLGSSRCPAALQEDLCSVLGTIASPGAVPALLAKLKKRLFLFSGQRAETERVRMRAAWALRKFPRTDVERALETVANNEKDPAALTARESLAIIRNK